MNTLRPDDHLPDEATEARLRAALSASATTRVPADRPAPPLDLPARSGPGRLLALGAAAAAVAAVAVGVSVVGDRSDRTLPATPSPTPTASVPTTTPPSRTPSPSPSETPTSTPSASPTRTEPDPPASARTEIGPATLVVPDGYRLRADGRDEGRWCLDTDGSRDCVVVIEEMDVERGRLDSDVEGGYESNPQLCRDEGFPDTHDLREYRDVEVGGRAGEYRQWRWGCHDGTTVDVAQVTVATPDAWTVYTDRASTAVRRVMDEVVSSLELPPATSSVRLYDRGVLRSVEPARNGMVRLEVDRVVARWPNGNPETYGYLAPEDLRVDGRPVAESVGRTVKLWTDGTVVSQVARD